MQNKSQLGGILTIVSGVLGLIWFLVIMAFIAFFKQIGGSYSFGYGLSDREVLSIIVLFYGFWAFLLLILGIISIVGGVYALKRQLWGLALAGAICSIFTFLPLGIVATIFTAQAQKEFQKPNPANAGTIVTPK
jgi:hypothetical protein